MHIQFTLKTECVQMSFSALSDVVFLCVYVRVRTLKDTRPWWDRKKPCARAPGVLL